MKLYRTRFQLSAATLTPWQADTLFGHLCWSLVRRTAEAGLQEFLQRYENRQPPILLSDGFPGEYLPRPALPAQPSANATAKQQRLAALRGAKADGHKQWLTLADFNRVRQGGRADKPLAKHELAVAWSERLQPKNQINRLTHTTGGEAGQLYELNEILLREITVYWKIEAAYEPIVRNFLTDLAATGFGKRKSIGYGQLVNVPDLEPFEEGFAEIPAANGFTTLSRFVPHAADPSNGWWATAVKYGKLGEEFATAGAPFKKPLIQLTCGSSFRVEAPLQWYGQMLNEIAEDAAIKHYAFAFALPLKLL